MLVLVLGELGGGGGQLGFSFCVTVLWWFAFLVRVFVAALSLAVGHGSVVTSRKIGGQHGAQVW